jgi:short-subunit dehydrogenase
MATMDVTQPEATSALDALIEKMGSPDLFLYVSGVGYQNLELDEEKEIRTVKTNCEGMVRMVDRFIHYVQSKPDDYSTSHKAHVAVVTSVAGTAGLGSAPAYSATKRMQSTYLSALAQFTRMEHIPIRVTDIRPGFVATDILNPDKHYPMLISRAKAADYILRGLRQKRRIVTFDWRFRLLVFFWRLIPRCLWERLTWVKI